MNKNRKLIEFWTKYRVPFVYDDTMSMLQLVMKVIKHLNLMIEDQNELKKAIKEFLLAFDEELLNTLEVKLIEWNNDGRLNELINETLFEMKADKTYVDGKLNNIVSGKPSGVFETIDDLKKEKPNGDGNIYITKDTGEWWYYDQSWKVGGKYLDEYANKTIVKNSVKFSELNEKTGWSDIFLDSYEFDGNAKFVASQKFGQLYSNIDGKKGDKFYFSIEVLANSPNVYVDVYSSPESAIQVSHSGNGKFQRLSGVSDRVIGKSRLRVIDGSEKEFKEVVFKNPLVINLTEVFGYGYEPSHKEVEVLLQENTGYYFSGTELFNFISLKNIYPKPPSNNNLKYNIEKIDGGYRIEYNKNGKNIVIDFGLRGVNNIPDFRSFMVDGEKINVSSDYLGPYKLKSLEGDSGDNVDSHHFTGGNHGYDNTGNLNQSSTSTTKNFKGMTEYGLEYGGANTFTITWENHVQGYNTTLKNGGGKSVLVERYTVIFDDKINIMNEVTFTHDVYVENFYWLQLQKRGKTILDNGGLGSTIIDNRKTHKLICHNYSTNKNNEKIKTFESSTKAYFNTLKNQKFLKDTTLILRGYYDVV